MIRVIDAVQDLDRSADVNCDVCIVGAGLAGIFLARLLADSGSNVIVLEAGDRVSKDEQEIGFPADQTGVTYKGATVGRAFGLGGTGTQWGGVLAPFTKSDLRPPTEGGGDIWEHIVSTVARHTPAVLAAIGFKATSSSAPYFQRLQASVVGSGASSNTLDLITAEVVPSGTRSFVGMLRPSRQPSGELTVYLRAVFNSFQVTELSDSEPVTRLALATAGSKSLRVASNAFVICAGAIESTRILLELQREKGSKIRTESDVGKYLGDHISSSIATVPRDDWVKTGSHFGPVFARGKMRSFRLVERDPPDILPRYFAHFIFEQENPGFGLAKKLLAAVQSRTVPDVTAAETWRGVSGLGLIGWNRFFQSRLYIPKGTPVHLQLDIEQTPTAQNKVLLGREPDEFGRPRAVVNWAIHDADYDAIEQTAKRVLTSWPNDDRRYPRVEPVIKGVVGNVHDAYHPVGTCRMGVDSVAVVGPDLRVHGNSNLFVLSTAIFPTAGTANPTFSMLCFARALVDSIGSQLGRTGGAS